MKKSMTKLKISLTNNFGIKIIAVLVAAILWLAVVNVNDPEKTVVIYNVPVTITHEDAITDLGMVYSLDSAERVNLTVSGKRSVVGNLSADDFKATASLKELSRVNSVPVEVKTKRSSLSGKINIVKQSIQTIVVNVESIDKQTFDIGAEFSGKAADGYVAGDYSLSNNSVEIKAPTSVIDRISKVVASCDLNGSSSDISQKCDLKLYDKRGRKIEDKNINMSIRKVNVEVKILKEKEVPIVIDSVGNPADGYEVADIKLSQDKVKLTGNEEVLAGIEKLEINGSVNISGKTKDVIKVIDLNKYLPEGITIDGDAKVEITVKIDKLVTKTYDIKTSDIDVEDLKDGAELKFYDEKIKIKLIGERDTMNKIKAEDLKVSISLKGLKDETVKVPLAIVIPEGTELVEQVSVKVKIK